MRPLALLTLLLLLASCATAPAPELRPGSWQAWLDSPGGELPFVLELRGEGASLEATLVNGEEHAPVSHAALDGSVLTLRIDPYGATVVATLSPDGSRLDGRWAKTAAAGANSGLEFHASRDERPRFGEAAAADPETIARIDGRWSVKFESDDQPAVGIFRVAGDGTASGTFLTTTGDYRYLSGHVHGARLRLSTFDGAHAFLFDATLQDDGTLAGEFWSRDNWHENWSARKDQGAALPDAFELTRWVGGTELSDVVFPDLDGRPTSLDDPRFAGRARIVEIFGSWCPNCNDATRFLVELDRTYRDRGLSIVGLAFEMTGELERDTEQVRLYAEHHGADYPMLIGGVSDKQEASRSFPLLDRIRSFPTTIFMDADGRVRAVHQGYAGPATGEANRELRLRFETLIQELLAESGPR